MKLKDKVVLITGGTSGIGLETARLFRDEGAQVAVVGTNPARLTRAAVELGHDALAIRADLRHLADIDAAITEVVTRYGRIDIVFANAGAATAAPLEEVTSEQIDEQFALNFKGLFFTVQKAAPYLSSGSAVIVTTSFLNEVGAPGLSILSATKAAVRSLVRSLGAELAPRRIRVNAVSPGPIATPFHGKLGLSAERVSQTAAALEAGVPLKRLGEPAEIAKAALFLASDDASYITGAELVVDGGFTQI
ncbi:SDR family oxidoreductase [Paraburkholderia humisilvae]|uniref:General stress protein 39 n=1 Tax=Paraburkholderia humisilvae TaxID=627669 RepID=A0A6J5EAZ9_9BURK|nr:SDR family oxidoreductase [Paraburkholderia humisilvae]CAB3762235.1 General stress protein 39 [Paraburkholderia humisilvae]